MKRNYLGIIFTDHAINRLYNRNIDQYDAWYTVKNHDGAASGKTDGSKKFFKNYKDQRIEVIAKKNRQGEWVVLSCWAKNQGTGKPIFRKDKDAIEKFITKALVNTVGLIGKLFKRK